MIGLIGVRLCSLDMISAGGGLDRVKGCCNTAAGGLEVNTPAVQAKAEEYFPESTRATTNTWPYHRYRETAGKLKLVVSQLQT